MAAERTVIFLQTDFFHYYSSLSGLIYLFCIILISLSLTYPQRREESLTKRAGVRSQCMCKFNWIHRKMSVLEADQSISASKYPHGLLWKMKNGKNRNVLTGLFLSREMVSFFSPASQNIILANVAMLKDISAVTLSWSVTGSWMLQGAEFSGKASLSASNSETTIHSIGCR